MAEPGHSPRPSTQAGATALSELGPPENTFTTRLKSLVENCVYGMLMQRFHKKGRGRPPDLPKGLLVTNKLLVQLYFLKGQHYSYADLKTWLADVDPNTTHVSGGRIIYRLDVILYHCDTLQTSLEQLEQYLNVNVDFNNLSKALSSIGLNRLHFSGDAQFLQPPVENLPNIVVYELEKYRSVNNETYTFVYKWLRTLCIPLVNLSDKQLKNKIQTVVSKCKTFSKKRDINGLNIYLECMFLQNNAVIESVESESAKHAASLRKKENEYSEIEKWNKQLRDEIKELKAELGIKNEIINKDCPKLRNENNSLGLTLKELKNELKELKKERDMLCKQNEEIQSSTLYKKNFEYKQKLNDLRDENKCLLESIEKDREQSRHAISKLKLKIKTEQSLKSQYKSSLAKEKEMKEQLQKMLQFDQDSQQTLTRNDGSSHRYSHNIRKTFYALQGEGNVAAINCSKVISIVAQNLFNVNITEDHLPCATSSLNFSNEAHVIAKSQISDEIINADHFTYACDGTSRQKASYLEKHIILSNRKQLSLGYSGVVTEDSSTLLETCISAFKEIVEIHCINEDEDVINQSDLFKDIIRKMKGLLSDRAAVMKAFDKKISEYKLDILQGEEASTYFLFCNAHFLLACEEAVQTLEEDMIQDSGKKLGRDANPKFSRFAGEKECATLRLLRTASKVLGPRRDEKSGCRQNWLAYCHQKKKRSLFTSY